MKFSALFRRAPLALCLGLLPLAASADLANLPAPQEPKIDVGGAGVIDYIAATDILSISGKPSSLFQNDPFLFGLFEGSSTNDEALFSVHVVVNSTGSLVESASNSDFQIVGAIDVNGDAVIDFDGVLLQGHVKQFGARDGGTAADDAFNIEVTNISGSLTKPSTLTPAAAVYNPTKSIIIEVTSEQSTEFATPFSGSWTADWTGQAKAVVGAGEAAQVAGCTLDVEGKALYNSSYKRKCRIDTGRTWKFWDFADRTHNGKTVKRWTYGEHGETKPYWWSRAPHANVTFRYVVANTGTVAVQGLQVSDSFEGSISNVPATLAPGQSVTLTRSASIAEELTNTVIVTGNNGAGGTCGDSDAIEVKPKIRDIRRHDYDRYSGKGGWDNNDRR